MFAMEPVAVREVCDAVSYELKYLFSEKQQSLKIHYSNHSRLVSANRELLYSVIYNFLINAIHYSNEETETLLSVKDSRGKVMVMVRDFGPEDGLINHCRLRCGQVHLGLVFLLLRDFLDTWVLM